MFELSVACKYLIPRRRQLSVSIISLISILVIATVVWLVVVFFSITEGLEHNWIQKLTSLTSPVRITPKESYFNSYYYLIDSISDASNYSLKTIGEKKTALLSDPYNSEIDQEIPAYWPLPDKDSQGKLKDLVKLAFASLDEIKDIPGLKAQDFALAATQVHLRLNRLTPFVKNQTLISKPTTSDITYPVFLNPFEADSLSLQKNLVSPTSSDLNHFLQSIPFHLNNKENASSQNLLSEKLVRFFSTVTVEKLKPQITGWPIPDTLRPQEGTWKGCAIVKDHIPIRVMIPQQAIHISLLEKQLQELGLNTQPCAIVFQDHETLIYLKNHKPFSDSHIPLYLESNASFSAQLINDSIQNAKKLSDLYFAVQIPIQDTVLISNIPYKNVEISQAKLNSSEVSPFWATVDSHLLSLPSDSEWGEGILLPKTFQTAGVLFGDRGTLSYLSQSATNLQENLLPIYVAGFYDPGIIPMGGKFLIANPNVTELIRSAHQSGDTHPLSQGINVRMTHLRDVDNVKKLLQQQFKDAGIDRYWNIETYKDFEFTKPILQELQSQKNLFMLIAVVIILVACSNIISMLIILVNDKKMEIGILKSMGATSASIAFIFGLSGGLIGILGSMIGMSIAILTLSHIDILVDLLSSLQGHEMFSTHLYGTSLPSELSLEALSFVCLATVFISLLAGIIPAIKASLLKPSQILRSGGE